MIRRIWCLLFGHSTSTASNTWDLSSYRVGRMVLCRRCWGEIDWHTYGPESWLVPPDVAARLLGITTTESAMLEYIRRNAR